MKYLKTYEDFEFDDNKIPTLDDLSQYNKEIMAGETEIQNFYDTYRIDPDKVKDLIRSAFLNPEFRTILTEKNIAIPDVKKLHCVLENKEDRLLFTYDLWDEPTEPEHSKFHLFIHIEIPLDHSHQKETLISGYVWIKSSNFFRNLDAYANKTIPKEPEFDYSALGDILHQTYDKILRKLS